MAINTIQHGRQLVSVYPFTLTGLVGLVWNGLFYATLHLNVLTRSGYRSVRTGLGVHRNNDIHTIMNIITL